MIHHLNEDESCFKKKHKETWINKSMVHSDLGSQLKKLKANVNESTIIGEAANHHETPNKQNRHSKDKTNGSDNLNWQENSTDNDSEDKSIISNLLQNENLLNLNGSDNLNWHENSTDNDSDFDIEHNNEILIEDDCMISIEESNNISNIIEESIDISGEKSYKKLPHIHHSMKDLYIMASKHKLKKSILEDISNWYDRARKQNYNHNQHFRTYNTVRNHLSNEYRSKIGDLPIQHNFSLMGLGTTVVYAFDILQQVKRLFMDSYLLQEGLWRYNKSDEYEDFNTGSYWRDAETMKAKQMGLDFLPMNHFLCPIILFDDSTVMDNIGRMNAQPILVTIGNINVSKRKEHQAWFLLGYIPPYPKSPEEAKKVRNSLKTKYNKDEFYHKCLEVLLAQLESLSKEQNGVSVYCKHVSRNINIHFDLAMIIGDTKGQDAMCGHYASYSKNTARIVRDCNTSTSDADNVKFKCTYSLQSTIKNTVEKALSNIEDHGGKLGINHNSCKGISQGLYISYYWRYDFGSEKHGVFGSLPYEVLHLVYLGLFKYLLEAIYNYRPVPNDLKEWYKLRCTSCGSGGELHMKPENKSNNIPSSTFRSDFFNSRYRIVSEAGKRQSDRGMPKIPFKMNGVESMTKLNGQEYVGIILLTMVCMNGLLCNEPESNEVDDVKSDENNFTKLLWDSLCLETILTQDSYERNKMSTLTEIFEIYLDSYKKIVGPQREMASSQGLRITKFHALKHFPFYIERYGNTHNFCGIYSEKNLKHIVKSLIDRTSKKHSSYLYELMLRYRESLICKSYDEKETDNSGSIKRKRDYNCKAEDIQIGVFRLLSEDFALSKNNGTFSIKSKEGKTFNKLEHPYMIGSESGSAWVNIAYDQMDTLNASKIRFFMRCDIVENEMEHAVIHCHPNFYTNNMFKTRSDSTSNYNSDTSKPWFDWLNVKWNDRNVYEQSAQLKLIALYENENIAHYDKKLMFIVQSLQSQPPLPTHPIIPDLVCDSLCNNVIIVEHTAIASVSYVLPYFQHDQNCRIGNENQKYIVIPHRSKWSDLLQQNYKIPENKRI